MKVLLIGYPGSQALVPVTRYLVSKYIPGVDVVFANHTGDINQWSAFVSGELEKLTDEKVIFGLDDYLIRSPVNADRFSEACAMKPCVKLCECTDQEHQEYPVTTQYTIWNRLELIELLSHTLNPWDFEVNGSKLFTGTSVVHSCLDYDTHSALSARWSGIKTDGLKQEDLDAIEKLL